LLECFCAIRETEPTVHPYLLQPACCPELCQENFETRPLVYNPSSVGTVIVERSMGESVRPYCFGSSPMLWIRVHPHQHPSLPYPDSFPTGPPHPGQISTRWEFPAVHFASTMFRPGENKQRLKSYDFVSKKTQPDPILRGQYGLMSHCPSF